MVICVLFPLVLSHSALPRVSVVISACSRFQFEDYARQIQNYGHAFTRHDMYDRHELQTVTSELLSLPDTSEHHRVEDCERRIDVKRLELGAVIQEHNLNISRDRLVALPFVKQSLSELQCYFESRISRVFPALAD